MNKPSKVEIINGIQFGLLMYTMLMGFYFSYGILWIQIGLPLEWWGFCILILVSCLSSFGLMQWIRNS